MTEDEAIELQRLAAADFDAKQAIAAAWKQCAPLVEEQHRARDNHTAAMRALLLIPLRDPSAAQLHAAAKSYAEDCLRALEAANERCAPVFEAWRRQCDLSREASQAYLAFFKKATATDGGRGE